MSIGVVLELAESLDPGRVVLGTRHGGLTAQRLAALAAGGASVLAAEGAHTLAFVGVSSPAFPVSIFAAARAGIPVAPLNYRLSPPQLKALLDRLDAPLVVADAAFAEAVSGAGHRFVTTEDWMGRCAADGRAAPPVDVDDEAPAVLLFTSGTTAEPKCVVLRHANLLSYVLGTVDPGSADEGDAALVSVPPYHIAGTGTVLTNIYAGRRLLYLPAFTPDSWLGQVRAEGVTFAMVVPTMLARVVEHLDGADAGVPSLKTLAYGGARMPRPILERALRLFPGVGFVNAYGLTETSSTIAVLGPDDHRAALADGDEAARARLSSVGQLVPGMEGQVRDAEGRPLPAGEVGELWVRGDQVSGEYAGAGSVLDPQGWFPTRDRAWFDPEEYLFIEGRSDDTIIRGGENVAPAEIEDVLLAHPDVAEAAVVGIPDVEWGERIVAAVVPTAGTRPDVELLRTWVRDRLRSAKTPDEVIFRSDLPHTDTGKLLRRQLVTEITATVPA